MHTINYNIIQLRVTCGLSYDILNARTSTHRERTVVPTRRVFNTCNIICFFTCKQITHGPRLEVAMCIAHAHHRVARRLASQVSKLENANILYHGYN